MSAGVKKRSMEAYFFNNSFLTYSPQPCWGWRGSSDTETGGVLAWMAASTERAGCRGTPDATVLLPASASPPPPARVYQEFLTPQQQGNGGSKCPALLG